MRIGIWKGGDEDVLVIEVVIFFYFEVENGWYFFGSGSCCGLVRFEDCVNLRISL